MPNVRVVNAYCEVNGVVPVRVTCTVPSPVKVFVVPPIRTLALGLNTAPAATFIVVLTLKLPVAPTVAEVFEIVRLL